MALTFLQTAKGEKVSKELALEKLPSQTEFQVSSSP